MNIKVVVNAFCVPNGLWYSVGVVVDGKAKGEYIFYCKEECGAFVRGVLGR